MEQKLTVDWYKSLEHDDKVYLMSLAYLNTSYDPDNDNSFKGLIDCLNNNTDNENISAAIKRFLIKYPITIDVKLTVEWFNNLPDEVKTKLTRASFHTHWDINRKYSVASVVRTLNDNRINSEVRIVVSQALETNPIN